MEAHGSRALTSIVASGTATIGRSFGHTLRRAVSVRHSSASRYSRDVRGHSRPSSRPSSLLSVNGSHRHSGSAIAEEPSSPNRLSGTFVDLRTHSADNSGSNRSSIVSTSSMSTIGSWNPASSHTPLTNQTSGPSPAPPGGDKSHHLTLVQRLGGANSPTLMKRESPIQIMHNLPRPSSATSSTSSLGQGGKSPQLSQHWMKKPQDQSPRSPLPLDESASSSSVESLQDPPPVYGTPI